MFASSSAGGILASLVAYSDSEDEDDDEEKKSKVVKATATSKYSHVLVVHPYHLTNLLLSFFISHQPFTSQPPFIQSSYFYLPSPSYYLFTTLRHLLTIETTSALPGLKLVPMPSLSVPAFVPMPMPSLKAPR